MDTSGTLTWTLTGHLYGRLWDTYVDTCMDTYVDTYGTLIWTLVGHLYGRFAREFCTYRTCSRVHTEHVLEYIQNMFQSTYRTCSRALCTRIFCVAFLCPMSCGLSFFFPYFVLVSLQNLFSCRMCSHVECVLMQNVFSCRMCCHRFRPYCSISLSMMVVQSHFFAVVK